MKVDNFSHFIDGDFQSIAGSSGKVNTGTWEILIASPTLNIRSNLEEYKKINL
jgi:hypothetical protein